MMSIVPRRRRNNLQDQQSTDKKNIPPTVPTQTKKPTRINRFPSLTQQGKWTFESYNMDVVERKQLSLGKANKFWHILITSLFKSLKSKARPRKQGL
jgi:hypothetical protein